MKSKNLLLASLIVGILWDILFWQKAPGISIPIFIMTCLIGGFLLLRSENHHPNHKTYGLMGLLLLFSVWACIRKDPLTIFLNVMLVFFFLLILSATYKSGSWSSFSILEYVRQMLVTIMNTITLPWKYLIGINQSQETEQKRKKNQIVRRLLRGLLLAIPVLVVFTALLSSADLIFQQNIQHMLADFDLENLTETILRGFMVLCVAYFFIGILQNAAAHSGHVGLERERTNISSFLSFIEIAVIMSSVILLFSVFVVIQFRYFFSGEVNISISGYTYAEYARRGFVELTLVAVFSLLLLRGLQSTATFENKGQQKVFKGISTILVALVLVILVSSFQRLTLYESAYGFTNLRLYAHIFIIWLGILLIGTILLEFLDRGQLFATASILAMVGFAITLNIINVDGFIVRHNIQRAVNGQELDTRFLASLSSDAVPALAQQYHSTSNEDLQRKIGNILTCHQEMLENSNSEQNHWQAFHFADWVAKRDLEKIDAILVDHECSFDEGRVFD